MLAWIRKPSRVVPVATIALLGVVGLVWRGSALEERRVRSAEALAVLEERLGQETHERAVLWGEALDGDGWAHYERALELVAAFDHGELLDVRAGVEDAKVVRRAEIATEGAELLAELRAGAHARTARRSVDLDQGFYQPFLKLLNTRKLLHVVEAHAQTCLDRGDESEAVRALLDVMQFGADVSDSPVMIEELIGVAGLVPDLLRTMIEDGTVFELSPSAFDELAAGVATLDRRLAWESHSCASELLLSVATVEHALERDFAANLLGEAPLDSEAFADWLVRRSLPGFVLEGAAHVEAQERLFACAPRQVLDGLVDFDVRVHDTRNPLSSVLLSGTASAIRGRLHSVGRLRLVAHVLSCRPEPRDPWLAELLRAEAVDGGERLSLAHEELARLELVVGG